MTTDKLDRTKRRFLIAATSTVGGVGLVLTSVPFIRSMGPSERVRAANAPVRVNVGKLQPGQQLTVEWRRRPVWVLRRSEEMLAGLEESSLRQRLRDPDSQETTQQPAYAQNTYRSIKPEYLVVIGICTHLSCVPSLRLAATGDGRELGWQGGYTCACHGSRFDLAGRVFKGVPAPRNLMVPPHRYLDEGLIECGVDPIASSGQSAAGASCCRRLVEVDQPPSGYRS